MDRLSEHRFTASYATGDLSRYSEVGLHVARGRALQRAALRQGFGAAARKLQKLFSGWGEARLNHPRSRAAC